MTLEAEDIVYASSGIISHEQAQIVLDAIELTQKEIAKKFCLGEIKLGRGTKSLQWKKCSEIIETFPSSVENTINQKENLTKLLHGAETKYQLLLEEENKIRKERQQIELLLSSYKIQNESLEKQIDSLIKIGSNSNQIINSSNKILLVEKELTQSMERQLNLNPSGFSSLTEISKKPKLSLIFNCMGLEKEKIASLRDLSGVVFNTSNFNNYLTFKNLVEVDQSNFKKDLLYIQHMMQINRINDNHKDDCPVCCCNSSNDLKNLLLEHDIRFCDFEVLIKKQINGPRALFLDPKDFYQLFNVKDINGATQFVEKLWMLHNECIYEYDNDEIVDDHQFYEFSCENMGYDAISDDIDLDYDDPPEDLRLFEEYKNLADDIDLFGDPKVQLYQVHEQEPNDYDDIFDF